MGCATTIFTILASNWKNQLIYKRGSVVIACQVSPAFQLNYKLLNLESCFFYFADQHSCFICKSNDGNRERCSISSCGKFYHRECLRSSLWPQARFSETQITCPYHMCHTCASDDPKDPHMKYSSKLLKCTRCPTSFHSGDYCVTAGESLFSSMEKNT